MEHLFQAHGLGTELDFILLLAAHLAVLVFYWIKPVWEGNAWYHTAAGVCKGLYAVTFSADPKSIGKYAVFIQFDLVPTLFNPGRVYLLMLFTSLCGVRAFCPELFIGQEGGPPETVTRLGQT